MQYSPGLIILHLHCQRVPSHAQFQAFLFNVICDDGIEQLELARRALHVKAAEYGFVVVLYHQAVVGEHEQARLGVPKPLFKGGLLRHSPAIGDKIQHTVEGKTFVFQHMIVYISEHFLIFRIEVAFDRKHC